MENSGFLLVNKPAGITSFGVIARLRKITNIKKIGHAGTLDPFATGLLIVAVGRDATKQISNYMKMDKVYDATFCFGATTETLDPEREMVRDPKFRPEKVTDPAIHDMAKKFIGAISQTPPAFSAIKIKGVRAYLLARFGKNPEIPSRIVNIAGITISTIERRDNLLFIKLTIGCGSGTYIRSLARDMAESVGTTGYVTQLHRTSIGTFQITDAKTLEELADSWQTSFFH